MGKFESPSDGEQRIVIWSNYWQWTILCAIYFACDPVIGMLTYTSGVLAMQIILGLKFLDEKENLFNGKLYSIICGINIFAWITQFIGHGIYEKRAPALLTNLLFIFLAPFFEMFEVLNSLTGYRQSEK